MIRELEISNFKCFSYAKLDFLKRFNVVVGESASGKTSLMEALFLHAGSTPEIYFRIRNWRGFGASISLTGTKEAYEAIFRDMFYDFDSSKTLGITTLDSEGERRSLHVAFKDNKNYALPLDRLTEHPFLIEPIVFTWNVGGREFESSLEISDGRLKIQGSAPPASLVYYNTTNYNSVQDASAFSSLSRRFKGASLSTELERVFPGVGNLSLEIVAGEPSLHVATGLSEKIPLIDLSGGVRKYVSIALGILANPKGTVIVDEIDAGFYYTHLASVWESFVRLCETNETQLIVTTHSYEFLKALAPSLSVQNLAKKFQLIRLEKAKIQPNIKRIDGEAYQAAIANDFEVR